MDVLCQSFPAMLHVEEKNPRGIDGKTKLEFAAEQGNFEVCKLIIDSINENSIKELSPLDLGDEKYGITSLSLCYQIAEEVKKLSNN